MKISDGFFKGFVTGGTIFLVFFLLFLLPRWRSLNDVSSNALRMYEIAAHDVENLKEACGDRCLNVVINHYTDRDLRIGQYLETE